ncbi:MAG: DMT family transporter [Saccharospirillaceae bacterium]|nr:DMT family transporter [Saccharospirillaceae bacterium]MCD8532852.1 DMT family transporter [Saccharospirillaceae bacterium]
MASTEPATPIPASTTDTDTARFGLILALSAAFLFSTKPIIIKWLYDLGMTALPLMWLRMMLATPVYMIVGWLAWKRLPVKPTAQQLLKAAGTGLLGYWLASYLDLRGLEYVSAQLERLMLYAYPTLVIILGALFFGQPFQRHHIAALILTYAGLILVYGQDLQFATDNATITQGTLLVLASALSFSLYILFSKNAIGNMGSLLFTSIAMGSAALATMLHYGIHYGVSLPDMDTTRWLGTVVLAIFATVIPSFLVSEAIKRIGPAKTSVSGTIGPVATTLMAIIVLGEPFGWLTAAGMALVMLGVSRLQR